MVTGINPPRQVTIIDICHPEYNDLENDWQLWRDTYNGGHRFIERYLKTYSTRETASEFAARKEITPCPSFAAAVIDDVKNNIYGQMNDITRAGGSKTYLEASTGINNGVDLAGSSMNHFIGQHILPELLTMRKVGVWIDMPSLNETPTLLEAQGKRPYLYWYCAEEIRNWVMLNPNEFQSLMLREKYVIYEQNFPKAYSTRYRKIYINNDGYVTVEFYDPQGNLTDFQTLNITRIPFVVFKLPKSLLKDIAKYQIALLNMSSADIAYILKANFPFYVEQQDGRQSSNNTGGGQKDIVVGTSSGRAYGQGLDQPGFINPSPDPLRVSMEKQDQMKAEIRQLVNLSISNLAPLKQQSAEAKGMDNQGLEAGLAFIGLELERGERKIAEYWADYEDSNPSTVNYPTQYSIKTDAERIEESQNDNKILPTIPSLTFQKALAKKIARNIVGHKVSKEVMDKIDGELDRVKFIPPIRADLQKDVELGIIDRENAAKACFYPDDAVEKANLEHGARLAEIAKSQAGAGARGVGDLGDPTDGTKEKTASRQTDLGNNKIPVRGKA